MKLLRLTKIRHHAATAKGPTVLGANLLPIFLLATPISGWVNLAEAQQPPKVPRMGFLRFHSPPIRNLEAFKQGLRGLGYEEG